MKTPSSQLIKDIAALRQKKVRDEAGLILVEGRHPIEEALKAGLVMRQLFMQPDQPNGFPAGIVLPLEPFGVDEKTMARMASTDSAPPCLAVFERPAPRQDVPGSLVLVLDEIQDPGNLGTLIRSAIAFGVDAVILTEGSVEPYNPKVIRSSAGLVFAVPLLSQKRAEFAAAFANGWTIYATTGQPQAKSYRDVEYAGPSIIVLGNEGRGISETLLQGCNVQPLTIPMRESVESLNVAISGSIVLAEAAARRKTMQPAGQEG